MKKIYNKNAREKQLLEEAYGAIYERRNPYSGTYDAEGELPGPIAELDPDEEEEHDEYHPGYGKVEDSITVGDIIDQVELDLPLTPDIADALQNVMDTVRSSLKYSPEDEEANVNWDEDKEVDEVGGGMNAKEFNTINKTTPL